MSIDIAKMTAAVASTGPNMTESVKGGGGGAFTPPEKGMTRLRFIAYVEVGQQVKKITGKPDKVEDTVMLTFELSGPKHPPKKLDDGTLIPFRKTLVLNRSLNEKATFYKLFTRMNYKGTATHMSQLLGQAFRGYVTVTTKGEGEAKRTYWDLKDDNGIAIMAPRVDNIDPETGEATQVELKVDEPISPMRLFVWNASPDLLKPMWDSLFIDGTYGEGENARSANVFQNAIKAAENFIGSPIEGLLKANGQAPDIPDEAPAALPKRDDDPLNSVV